MPRSNTTTAPKPPASKPVEVPLKIGLIFDDSLDRPDGVQQYVLTLGAWLNAQGHDVHYVVSTTTRTDVPNVHTLSRNVSVRFNANRMGMPLPASRAAVRALLTREKFDVLHVQTPYSPFLAGKVISAAPPDTAVIGTFHILPDSRSVTMANYALAWWCRRTLGRFDAWCSVSEAARHFARQVYRLDSAVVPNAVALAPFQTAQPLPRKPADPPTVLFLGRLVPRKGCLLLLQAAVLLRVSGGPDCRIVICGKGPLRPQLEQFVAANHLEKMVTFTGFVSEADKPRYLASADVAVFPSSGGESFGIVLIEAMASGRAAVIAGDNPGYRSVLDACPEPVLFDPHDPAALARRISELLTDRAQRRHIADWQQHYAANFDIGRVGPQLVKIYHSVLRRRRNMR